MHPHLNFQVQLLATSKITEFVTKLQKSRP